MNEYEFHGFLKIIDHLSHKIHDYFFARKNKKKRQTYDTRQEKNDSSTQLSGDQVKKNEKKGICKEFYITFREEFWRKFQDIIQKKLDLQKEVSSSAVNLQEIS